MIYICPYCRHEITEGRSCSNPTCTNPIVGETFSTYDWPEHAYLPGKRIRSPENGCYLFPTADIPVQGMLQTQYRQDLSGHKKISIGGKDQHISIADVATPLAEFYEHFRRPEEWWVVRLDAATKIVLNGKQEIDNCRLEEGDIVTIAGVPILFTGKSLLAGQLDQPKICLETRDLCFEKRRNKILNRIDFRIRSGEFIGVLGPSGCGKSSLIQQLVGLSHSTSGEILINGKTYAKSIKNMRPLTAYMPQTVALHNDLTLEEEFKSFSLLHDTSIEDAEVKLALVGMVQETSKRIGDLSGGQQRRVGIALELLREPQLLVLDEPTAGLDPASETLVMKYLRRLADQGKAVVCATHIMDNLDKFDKLLVLSKGCEVFFGTRQELLPYFQKRFHYSKVSSPVDLYDLLGSGSDDQQRERAEKLAQNFRETTADISEIAEAQSPLPKRRRIPLWKQYCGYLLRQAMEFFSFRHARHPFCAFWTSACFIQLLLQPILTAVVLKLACAKLFYTNDILHIFDLYFFSCLAVFWLGLNNSIRELVRERIPWRCLERLEKITMTGYLVAKISWSALLALIQTALFHILVYVLPPFVIIADRMGTGPNSEPVPLVVHPESMFPVLYGACLLGVLVGLALSAIFAKENAAIAMLPIILVPVLFFSGTIIGDIHSPEAGQYNKLAASIEKWMPCHDPADYLKRRQQRKDELHKIRADGEKNESQKSEAISKLKPIHYPVKREITFALVFLAILISSQYLREKNWEGR